MPDTPIKPPNKKVEENTTNITINQVSLLFKNEPNELKRANMIITYLIKRLAKIQSEIQSIGETE